MANDPNTPPAPDPKPEGAPPAQSGGDQDPGNNQVQALTRKLRKAEKLIESFQTAEEARKQSQLSETEKLQKKVADLEAALNGERATAKKALIQSRFEQLALKAGAQNPAAAYKLANLADVDSADDTATLETALAALRKSDPYLFGTPKTEAPTVGSGGGNPPNGNGKTSYSADQVANAAPDEWARIQAEITAGRAILK